MSDPHTCLRSQEFGKLISDVKNVKEDVAILNKAVMQGNGEPPLNASVPMLSRTVEELTVVTGKLKTGVTQFLQYQKEQEGYRKGKQTVRMRDRWLIGIMVTIILCLLVGLIGSVTSNRAEQKTKSPVEQTK